MMSMIYSQSARYAIAALAALASLGEAESDGPVLVKELAAKINAPYHYLSKISLSLAKQGFINSIRGRGGGLTLARKASEITLEEIVIAIDGADSMNACAFDSGTCDERVDCAMHEYWAPARSNLLSFLRETKITDLANR